MAFNLKHKNGKNERHTEGKGNIKMFYGGKSTYDLY